MSADSRIRQTLALYAQRHDARDAEGFVSLFVEDALFVMRGRELVGRGAITETMTALYSNQPSDRRTKHLCGDALINVEGAEATALSDVVVLDRVGGGPWQIYQVNRYIDHMVKVENRWLFIERRIEEC